MAKRARPKITGLIFPKTREPVCGEAYEATDFVDLRMWNCRYQDCIWTDCKFHHVAMGNGMEFTRCRFVNCKFLTGYTSIQAKFKGCTFENCQFTGVLMFGSELEDCVVSGLMKGMVFFGEKAPKQRTVLRRVDMREVIFDMTDFRLKVDLSTVQFGPQPGTLLIETKLVTPS